jgi:hypothetical protein
MEKEKDDYQRRKQRWNKLFMKMTLWNGKREYAYF